VDLATDRFTLGVFRDIASADLGIEALVRHNFPLTSLSIIAQASPDLEAFVQRIFGARPATVEVKNLGQGALHGPLISVLDADNGLLTLGIAGTARRAGFQSHDGVIFERLVAKGGVLVAVSSEGRGSEAVSTLHAYGGGNAAIGAWTGRV
jgi:hypothetical protein